MAARSRLKSKLRIGTEVVITFPPERVMSALAPIETPPLQPDFTVEAARARRQTPCPRNKPIMNAGTGL